MAWLQLHCNKGSGGCLVEVCEGSGGVWWGSSGCLVGVWKRSGNPPRHHLDPSQTPQTPSPYPSQDISQTPSRTLRDSDQTHTRCPPDTLQLPSTPLPDSHQTPLRPKPPIHPHRHPLRHHPDTLDPHFGFGLKRMVPGVYQSWLNYWTHRPC